MTRLIVNADDLGLTRGVNRAIFRAQKDGIVTSATLMANANAFDDAVAGLGAMSARALSVGCHIVLVDGTPLSASPAIPSLLDSEQEARFRRKFWKFALAASRGLISAQEVETEATAQIRKIQQAGIEVSHLDCHKHAHMFPAVLEGVLRAAATTGVGAIRNPFEPGFARPAAVMFSGKNAIRSAETALLHRKYARQFREMVQQHGLVTTDGSIGVTVTGALDLKLFAESLRHLPTTGTYEFVCHPGYNDANLAAAGTRLLQSRETELSVLCSEEARAILRARNVELISFWRLPASPESKPTVSHPMA